MSEAQHLSDKPVLVTGASGFMGSHITRLLVAQGRKVRILLRKTSSTVALEGLPVEIRYGDVLDRSSLKAAMEGCQTVFYSVVDPRFWLTDQTPIYRNNVEGLINAMDMALECGIERFVFTSTMGTLGLNPNGPVTEDIEFNWHDTAPPYILARKEAEDKLFEYCRDRGLSGVAVCVANTYGPQDYQPTPHGGMLWKIASGQVKATLDVGAPAVDIRDAAQAALLAEQYGRVGERYIISGPFISNKEFFGIATRIGGVKPPRLISQKVGYFFAGIIEAFFKLTGRKDYLVSTKAVYLSNVFQALDSGKAQRELHWKPRPIEDTIRDAVEWYAQHHQSQSQSQQEPAQKNQ